MFSLYNSITLGLGNVSFSLFYCFLLYFSCVVTLIDYSKDPNFWGTEDSSLTTPLSFHPYKYKNLSMRLIALIVKFEIMALSEFCRVISGSRYCFCALGSPSEGLGWFRLSMFLKWLKLSKKHDKSLLGPDKRDVRWLAEGCQLIDSSYSCLRKATKGIRVNFSVFKKKMKFGEWTVSFVLNLSLSSRSDESINKKNISWNNLKKSQNTN